MSVLTEAEGLINGVKRDDYGGARESFERIAAMWSPILGVEVTPEQVCFCMVQLKISRWLHGQQHDSLVDMAGYTGLVETVHAERQGEQ